MKRIVLALLLCGAALGAGEAGPASVRVIIRLVDEANIPQWTLMRATAEVSRIFATVGVRVRWTDRKPYVGPSVEQSGCASPERLITVRVIAEAPDDVLPTAQAVANTGADAITVFYDHVRLTVASNQRMSGPFLGHVLAHEVAHVLQVVAQHADSGIMKAQFTTKDLHDMEEGKLRFTDLDIRLIRAGLASRSCSFHGRSGGEAWMTKTPML